MIILNYTVDKIKNSATKIFCEKGYNGSRITEIARDAEVSKSLLHYYFRTKEQLFKIIVDESIHLVVKNMSPILKKELSFFELVDQFIYNILALFKENNKLLSFIIHEYNQNLDKIESELKPISNFFKEFEYQIRIQSEKENIPIKDTKHFIVNIVSLCGWHIIGVNIFSLKQLGNSNSNSINITETNKNIFETVVSSLGIH